MGRNGARPNLKAAGGTECQHIVFVEKLAGFGMIFQCHSQEDRA